MPTSPIIGIDLGTTFSLASVLQNGKPVILPNAMGEALTPSAVSLADNGELLVGAAARARATTHPQNTVLAFKRDMGTPRTWKLGEQEFTPQFLSAMVLRALKQDAEAALGVQIEEAVVTVPAYFGDLQRQATRDAGAIAGLRVERIINEPTAAALAYGLHHKSRQLKAAVLDLGGGTFDVTILEIVEGVIEIQASAGDARLGGEDFDRVLAQLVSERIRKAHGVDTQTDQLASARLKQAAEDAKKRLTSEETTRVVVPELKVAGKTIHVDEVLTRAEAESAWQQLLERVRAPIIRALNDAKLAANGVDEVLLVGGSTRMPVVARLAATIFGKMPLRTLPPDEAIAMGAAVQAALKAGDSAVDDIVVTDVAPFTLGLSTATTIGRNMITGVFSPIIERGTVIPCSRVERFFPMGDNQTRIDVEVFQGEHAQCSRNQLLGEYQLKNLPPVPRADNGVDVRFTYDLNGILEIEMRRCATGQVESFVIEQRPGKLSPEGLAKAREQMKALKLHPRDALPNTTALARAEALHAELTGNARAQLAQAIAAFRGVIESQNPNAIADARGQLNAMIEAFRSRA